MVEELRAHQSQRRGLCHDTLAARERLVEEVQAEGPLEHRTAEDHEEMMHQLYPTTECLPST